MATVTVVLELLGQLSHRANGQRLLSRSGESVREVLLGVCEEYPQLKAVIFNKHGELGPVVAVFLNDARVRPDVEPVPVRPGDRIVLVAAIAGG